MPYVCDVPSLRTAALPQYILTKIIQTKNYETFNVGLQYWTVFSLHLWMYWLKKKVISIVCFLFGNKKDHKLNVRCVEETGSAADFLFQLICLIKTNFTHWGGATRCNQQTLILLPVGKNLTCGSQGFFLQGWGGAVDDSGPIKCWLYCTALMPTRDWGNFLWNIIWISNTEYMAIFWWDADIVRMSNWTKGNIWA